MVTIVCGDVFTAGVVGSGVFIGCVVVLVVEAVLVFSVFAAATDCLRERPIRFTWVVGVPILY